MVRKLTFAAAIVVLALIGIEAAADEPPIIVEPGCPVVVDYFVTGSVGGLTVFGGAGLDFEAFDLGGLPVAGGVLTESVTTLVLPMSGGAQVRVGGEFFDCTTDPDWNWD